MSEEILKELLEEVKAIKEASVPAPAAPAPKPKGFMEEFMGFLSKYGVVGLAVAFIIGGAAGRLVQALVNDILMPVITFFIPGGAWQEATLTLGPIVLGVGHFVAAILDFLIIALAVFWIMKAIEKTPLK
jgi:large conductance mechanosensitive channel